MDPRLDSLLRDLDGLFRSQRIAYLLTVGMAREILLHYGHGCASGRTTLDVDFGITISSWADFEALQTVLGNSGRFRLDPKEVQRMIHRDPTTGIESRVDLVPFGAIAGPDGEIAWPPDGSHTMRVLGYAQALTDVVRLRLDAATWIPLASGPGLALMKLVAWMDHGEARLGRDAVDFLELLHQYSYVLTDEELYDDFPEAMDAYDFQMEPAAAWILGRQVANLSEGTLRPIIRAALEADSRHRMLGHFLRERSPLDAEPRLTEAVRLLEAFKKGWQGNPT